MEQATSAAARGQANNEWTNWLNLWMNVFGAAEDGSAGITHQINTFINHQSQSVEWDWWNECWFVEWLIKINIITVIVILIMAILMISQ